MRSEGYSTWVSVYVCVSVCLKSLLTYGVSVHPENAVTYSFSEEGQKRGDLPETIAFKGYATKHEQKSQYTIILYRGQLSSLDT